MSLDPETRNGVIGQLLVITESDLTVLFKKERATFPHTFGYEYLEELADQALGQTVILQTMNGRVTRVKVS